MFLQYSDTIGYQGILQDIDFLVNTDATTYSTSHKTRNINQRYREILGWIFEAYDGWQFNDSNDSTTTDTLYSDLNITTGISIYAIPATAIMITGAGILLNGTSVYEKLLPFTQELVQQRDDPSQFLNQNSVPRTYQLFGDTIKILPPPSWTASSSLRVYFWKDISEFAVTDTAKVPGISPILHRALSIGGALDFAMANKPDKVEKLQNLWDGPNNPNSYKARITRFYSHRFHELNPPRFSVQDAGQEFK